MPAARVREQDATTHDKHEGTGRRQPSQQQRRGPVRQAQATNLTAAVPGQVRASWNAGIRGRCGGGGASRRDHRLSGAAQGLGAQSGLNPLGHLARHRRRGDAGEQAGHAGKIGADLRALSAARQVCAYPGRSTRVGSSSLVVGQFVGTEMTDQCGSSLPSCAGRTAPVPNRFPVWPSWFDVGSELAGT